MPDQPTTPPDPAPGLTIPVRGPRITLGAVAAWGGVLFWLSAEDHGLLAASLWGAVVAGLITGLATLNRFGGRRLGTVRGVGALAVLGGLAGLLAAPSAAGLMVLKTALHAHQFPDYPLLVIGAVLARTPAWGLAGACIGLGIGLVWLARVRA